MYFETSAGRQANNGIAGWPSRQRPSMSSTRQSKAGTNIAGRPSVFNNFGRTKPMNKSVNKIAAGRPYAVIRSSMNAASVDQPQTGPGVNPGSKTPDGAGGAKQGCPTFTHFAVGSANVPPMHLSAIQALARQIVDGNIKTVVTTGHADAAGTDENNLALGYKRSVNMRIALSNALHRIKPYSQTAVFWRIDTKGESDPVSTSDPALNRRVTVCFQNCTCD